MTIKYSLSMTPKKEESVHLFIFSLPFHSILWRQLTSLWKVEASREMTFISKCVKLSVVCLSIVHVYAGVRGQGALRVFPSVVVVEGNTVSEEVSIKEVYTTDPLDAIAVEGT